MRIQIDTKEKEVILTETVPLGELVSYLKSIFPDDWKQYRISGQSTIYTYYPFHSPYPYCDPDQTQITCSTTRLIFDKDES